MDAELKKKWTTALRSGDYKQGYQKFLKDGKYCCLGVLCVVAGESPYRNEIDTTVGNWNFVRRVIGHYFVSDDRTGDATSILAYKNDNGWTFPEIADWIEENL